MSTLVEMIEALQADCRERGDNVDGIYHPVAASAYGSFVGALDPILAAAREQGSALCRQAADITNLRMTDPRIEQKSREVAEELLPYLKNGWVRPDVARVIAAALQSAVDEEREECAKIPRRIAPSAGACINEIENAIRARGQKETVCNCPQLNGPDANQHDMECPAYRRPHKETA